jgi:hypothetical protein
MVEYLGSQDSSALALAFERGIRNDISPAMYGAISRGSHAGTLKGAGDPVDFARASTIWLMLTG